jgi:hypothetical protein
MLHFRVLKYSRHVFRIEGSNSIFCMNHTKRRVVLCWKKNQLKFNDFLVKNTQTCITTGGRSHTGHRPPHCILLLPRSSPIYRDFKHQQRGCKMAVPIRSTDVAPSGPPAAGQALDRLVVAGWIPCGDTPCGPPGTRASAEVVSLRSQRSGAGPCVGVSPVTASPGRHRATNTLVVRRLPPNMWGRQCAGDAWPEEEPDSLRL